MGVLTFCRATEPEMDELIQWILGGGGIGGGYDRLHTVKAVRGRRPLL